MKKQIRETENALSIYLGSIVGNSWPQSVGRYRIALGIVRRCSLAIVGQSAGEKSVQRKQQVSALQQSVSFTQELFQLGTSTYLEVLTAQQGLFSAQLLQVTDRFEQMQSVINLYHALGGGRE